MVGSHAADRTAFLAALDANLARDESSVTVVRIDLDRFSRIREVFGKSVSRAVRSTIAQRLADFGGTQGRVLSYGEDAFVLIVTVRDPSPLGLETMGMELITSVSAPIDIVDQPPIAVGCNAGIAAAALFDGADPLRLLAGAELAIQQANALGSRRAIVYQVAPTDDPTRLPQLFAEMLGALDADQFQPYFQPVVALPDRRIVGAEALARWIHPVHGVIMPAEFIPEAERSGLVRQIDAQVWSRAATAMREMAGGLDLSLSLNLSPADLDFPDLIDHVRGLIDSSGLAPGRLVLEVTETALSQDWSRARRRLEALKDMGVRVAVDDFGAGHMYLDRLSTGLFDVLKVDRSIVAPEDGRGAHGAALLSGVTALAKGLGMTVVAEGIETDDQLRRTLEAGCDRGQGYLFARPMPAAAYAELVAAGS